MEKERKDYILSKALASGIKQLTKEVKSFTKDEDAKQDLQDMQELYNWAYPSYVPIQGWGDEVQKPTPTVATTTLASTDLFYTS